MTQPPPQLPDDNQAGALRRLVIATTVLTLAFGLPLYELLRFSFQSRLYSHVFLIPVISIACVWFEYRTLPAFSTPQRILSTVLVFLGLALLGGDLVARLNGTPLEHVDRLALTTLSYLCCMAGLCAWFLGRPLLRAVAYPLAFLLFMVPLPNAVETATETFLQHGSARTALGLFNLAGTTVFAEGLSFQLPGITLQVAPECSGIHSSLALLIVSIVAGRFLLRSPWRRLILALAVIPLALMRNGLRVFVIGELCVRKGPHMIDSFVHHQGGPIFFVISLVPFFLLLAWLIRSERKTLQKPSATSP